MKNSQGHFRPRGFSLIEIVIVLFLAGVMLFCVAGLTDRTFKTLKFLQQKSSTLESATLACERLATELRETVVAPTVGSTVTFRKVVPNKPYKVGNLPIDGPLSWTRVYPNNQMAQIQYRMSVGDRKVKRQVNSEPSYDVAGEVNTFLVTQVPNAQGNYRIALTILESRRAVTFETIVSCPGVPRS